MAHRRGYSFEDAWTSARTSSLIAQVLLHDNRDGTDRRDESFARRIVIPVFRCVLIGAGAPALFNLLFWLLDPRAGIVLFAMSPQDYPLAISLLVVTTGMLIAGWAGLRFVDDRKDELDLTLRVRADREQLENFVKGYFSVWVQAGFVVVFWAALWVWMAVWAEDHGHDFSIGGRLSAMWTVALGALCLQWCLPLPAVLDRLLRPRTRPHLIPHDPVSTPWVGVISRLISLGGGLMTALAILAAVLSASLAITGRPTDPSSVAALATDMLPAVTVILIITAVWFWVIPGWQLTSIVTEGKRRELARIEKQLEAYSPDGSADQREARLRLIEEYRLVSAAPDSPFTSQRVAQYATLVAAVVAVLLSPLLRLYLGIELG
jgi:hypothetical protein